MTVQEYKDINELSYAQLGMMFGCSKARAYDICRGKGGDLRISELNRIMVASEGQIQARDMGLRSQGSELRGDN